MASETDVANFALGHLGESILPDLLGTDKATNTVNLWKDHARRLVLRMANWTCAMKRDTITKDGTAPEYGFTGRFELPSDFIRLASIGGNRGRSYSIEAGYILYWDYDEISIRYVYDLSDYTLMDEDLIDAIALALAYDMAPALTQSNNRREEMWSALLQSLTVAKNVDTTGSRPQAFLPGSWIWSRTGG